MTNSEIYTLRLSKIGEALTILPVKEMGSQYALDFLACPLPESVCKQKINEQFSTAYKAGGYEDKGISKERYIDMGISHILKSPFFGDANKVLLEGDRVILVYKTNSIFTLEQLLKELHANEIKKAVEAGKSVDWDAVEEDHPGVFNKSESPEDPMQGFNSDFEDMLYGSEEKARNSLFTSDPGLINKLQSSRENQADGNLSPLDFFSSGASQSTSSPSLRDENAEAEARFSMAERKAKSSFSDFLTDSDKTQAANAVMDVNGLVKKKDSADYIKDVFVFNENLSTQDPGNQGQIAGFNTNSDSYFDALESTEEKKEMDVHTQSFDFGSQGSDNGGTELVGASHESFETSIEDGLINAQPAALQNVESTVQKQGNGIAAGTGHEGFDFEPSSGVNGTKSSEGLLVDESQAVNESVVGTEPTSVFKPETATTPIEGALLSAEGVDHEATFDFGAASTSTQSEVLNNTQEAPANFNFDMEQVQPAQPSEKTREAHIMGRTFPNFDFEPTHEPAAALKGTEETEGAEPGFNFDNEQPKAEIRDQKVALEANGWVDNETFGGLEGSAPWESTLATFGKKRGHSEGKGN